VVLPSTAMSEGVTRFAGKRARSVSGNRRGDVLNRLGGGESEGDLVTDTAPGAVEVEGIASQSECCQWRRPHSCCLNPEVPTTAKLQIAAIAGAPASRSSSSTDQWSLA
jgi:hypothetical protein